MIKSGRLGLLLDDGLGNVAEHQALVIANGFASYLPLVERSWP